MYGAKHAGRAGFRVFDVEMEESASWRHTTEIALRGALSRDELEIWYQPLVNLSTSRISGFEALARWRRPGMGPVAPGDFIGVAEELGLIDEIDRWVLEQASRQLLRWQALEPRLFMSVNVLGRELARADYVDGVAAALDSVGVAPEGLRLEITESVMLEDADAVQQRLVALKKLGVSLAIDDFGTSYSPLRYLRQLPVDMLKIDRTFVSADGDGISDEAIVKSVTDLGHSMGLGVVAEGIETEEQLQALRSIGVDSGQGYLSGRPMVAEDATDLLSEQGVQGLAPFQR